MHTWAWLKLFGYHSGVSKINNILMTSQNHTELRTRFEYFHTNNQRAYVFMKRNYLTCERNIHDA